MMAIWVCHENNIGGLLGKKARRDGERRGERNEVQDETRRSGAAGNRVVVVVAGGPAVETDGRDRFVEDLEHWIDSGGWIERETGPRRTADGTDRVSEPDVG